MAKITTFLVEAVKIPDHDGGEYVHITGLGFGAPNTLCGICDDGQKEPIDETPTCPACIEVYESIKKHRPRFKF